MNLNEYQIVVHETAIYRPEDAQVYLKLNLYSKSGEVAGLVAESIRDQCEIDYIKLNYELGNLLWHCAEIRTLHGLTMPTDIQAMQFGSPTEACNALIQYVQIAYTHLKGESWSLLVATHTIPNIMSVIQWFGSLYGATLESIAQRQPQQTCNLARFKIISKGNKP